MILLRRRTNEERTVHEEDQNICSLTKSLAINDFKSKYAGSYFDCYGRY